MTNQDRTKTGVRREVDRAVVEVVAASPHLRARPLSGDPRKRIQVFDAGGSRLAPGDIILVERQGRSWRQLGARLAAAGSFRASVHHVAARLGLDPVFPEAVRQEAAAWQAEPGVDDPELKDLTAIPFVTIDNPSSRDLDQALHVCRDPKERGFVVRYALADAAHFVRPCSALHEEALSRGASYYLPGLTVPMLPRVLCEGVVSLNPRQDRRALVFHMRLDGEGRCIGAELARARVHSVGKLSYPQVQRYYDDPGGSGLRGEPWRETLDLLRQVGELRLAEARQRHVVHYDRKEVEIRVADGQALGFTVEARSRLPVERYNEQISLLCNVEGARLLASAGGLDHVQGVFRVHAAPAPEALAHLSQLIDAAIEAHQLDPAQWAWHRSDGEPLADYLERLPRRGSGRGLSRAIERQARLVNERSLFDESAAPHHGVGAPVYARFSAPMREIVGIFTHKETFELLAGPDEASAPFADEELRRRVVEAGNRAREVQKRADREVERLALDRVLGNELAVVPSQRRVLRGVVMGITPSRIHVRLGRPALDVKVYMEDLEQGLGTGLEVDEHGVTVARRGARGAPLLRLGDQVELRVAGYDDERRRWRLELAGPPGR